MKDAFIDISVTCMKCDSVLYYGVYKPGIIGKLKKSIHNNGWIHHPVYGTLCPQCYKKVENEDESTEF